MKHRRPSSFVHYSLFILLAVVLTGCKPQLPAGVISESRMAQILHDYHIAQGMAESGPREEGQTTDELLYIYQQAVFRKYGITYEDFERSMAFYCSDMDRLVRIYKNVDTRLEREAEALGVMASDNQRDIYSDLTQYGDTANVWADRLMVALKANILDNLYEWHIDADSTWFNGDDLLWRFQVTQLARSGIAAMEVDLIVTYTNDSVRSAITHITTNPQVELRIKSPDAWQPREISGHAYLALGDDNQDYRLMLLHHPLLVRMHKPEDVRRTALRADSLGLDSITADSIMADSLARIKADSVGERRLSPSEFREQQDVEHTINVIKEQRFDPRGKRKGYPTRQRPRRRG